MTINKVINHVSQLDRHGATVSWQRQQHDFMRVMRSNGWDNHIKTQVTEAQVELCHKLIDEEVTTELFPALQKFYREQTLENRTGVADACIDSIYVILQLMNTLGLPAERLFAEVHRSNMTKVDPVTGEVIKNAFGKVLKPASWTPPNLWQILFEEDTRIALQTLPVLTAKHADFEDAPAAGETNEQ